MENESTIGGYILIDDDGLIIYNLENYTNSVNEMLYNKMLLNKHHIHSEIVAITGNTNEEIEADYQRFINGDTETFYEFTNAYNDII